LWNFLTPAKIEVTGGTAKLAQDSGVLSLRILSPAGARFEVISANPAPPQKQQPDIQNLTVRLAEKVKSVRIAVLITVGKEPGPAMNLEALDQWAGR
jgi:hypothetical protein